MEFRGETVDMSSDSRPSIARRSCDHCRARKIGCDRGSPCSNCKTARLHCTHSAVAAKAVNPKQRVIITAQYEQKIDDIKQSVDGIKQLLQGLDFRSGATPQEHDGSHPVLYLNDEKISYPAVVEPEWDYSGHIVDFIKAIVNDRDIQLSGIDQSNIVSSLKSLLHTVEGNRYGPNPSIPKISTVKHQANSLMPPLDAAVAVLRWAKAHDGDTRNMWISHVLPLEMFSEVCRKVYFAIDDYNEVEFILANGYLSYVFSEHVSVTGLPDYQEYFQLCRENVHNACARLPLLLPPSMEVIAALTIGAFNAVEGFRVSSAWTLISSASNLCQTLGYHLASKTKESDRLLQAAQASLFWTVYRMEKGLSLRLGRSSNIRDIDVTLPIEGGDERHARLARIQGKIWDQLYSPTSLAQGDGSLRAQLAEALASELRELIGKTNAEISDTTKALDDNGQVTSQDVYLQTELVCQTSLLPLILRAIPPVPGSLESTSDDCVTAARDVLDLHQQCVTSMREHKKDPMMLSKYLSWSVVHHPFVPFSILFSRAVQMLDIDDLARLERFAASLELEQISTKPSTDFQQIYRLLCQAARLYIDARTLSLTETQTLSYHVRNTSDHVNFTSFDMAAATVVNEGPEPPILQSNDLSEWYFGNRQFMSLLDEDIMFQ